MPGSTQSDFIVETSSESSDEFLNFNDGHKAGVQVAPKLIFQAIANHDQLKLSSLLQKLDQNQVL
jgi:hypothetical protein